MNRLQFLAIGLSLAPLALGSTLTAIGDAAGTTYTISGLAESEKPAAFSGMLVSVVLAGGSTDNCTFTGGGGPGGQCTGAGFSIGFNNNNDLATAGGTTWMITNSSGVDMTSITFSGLTGTTLTIFTPCGPAGPGGTTSGSTCLTASSPAGTSTGSATVTYLDAVHTVGQTIPDLTGLALQWNAFATLRLDFTGFATGTTFGFSQDADTIGSAIVDVTATPEPSGLLLLGGGLAMLASVKKLGRSSSV